MATDYAAQIAAANLTTLADARRLRASMMENADNKAQRQFIGTLFEPILARLTPPPTPAPARTLTSGGILDVTYTEPAVGFARNKG